jgi:Topoisomerase IA
MTDQAIKDGFANLKDSSDYDNLFASAKCRSVADWLVGLNATRLYSIKYNSKLNIGRVQTPTVAMIVKRQEEIDRFVSVPFHEIEADGDSFKAKWFNNDGTRFDKRSDAEAIVQKCQGNPEKL